MNQDGKVFEFSESDNSKEKERNKPFPINQNGTMRILK
jgi:hypothetical protein